MNWKFFLHFQEPPVLPAANFQKMEDCRILQEHTSIGTYFVNPPQIHLLSKKGKTLECDTAFYHAYVLNDSLPESTDYF